MATLYVDKLGIVGWLQPYKMRSTWWYPAGVIKGL